MASMGHVCLRNSSPCSIDRFRTFPSFRYQDQSSTAAGSATSVPHFATQRESEKCEVSFGKKYSHPCLHHLENSAKSDPAAGRPSTPSSGCPRAVSATQISNVLSGWSRQRDRIITNLVYYLIFRQRAILEGLRVKFIAEGDGF